MDTPGWIRFKNIARREKKMIRLIKQAKLRSFRTAPKYLYGYRIPKSYKEAILFDLENGNRNWRDATFTEMKQLIDYQTFIDKGTYHPSKIPRDFRKITGHLIFTIKEDGRFKARYCAGGHLTDPPTSSVYSGVVSLRGFRTLVFLGELNDMPVHATDIGNAYLHAKTSERVCIRAGEEFKEFGMEGHLLIIVRALYGLKSSGKAFNILLAQCLTNLGFERSKCESDIWLRKCETRDCYEYVATYVNDLAVCMVDPWEFFKTLESKP